MISNNINTYKDKRVEVTLIWVRPRKEYIFSGYKVVQVRWYVYNDKEAEMIHYNLWDLDLWVEVIKYVIFKFSSK